MLDAQPTDVTFSIIIPFKDANAYVRETVSHVLNMTRPDFELLLVPNDPMEPGWNDQRIRVLASGRVGPGSKRDMAAKVARGHILVFLDDDSYPNVDLLDVAAPYFDDPQISAIGGPALTPEGDTFWQRVSGAVFLSRFAGGAPERYVPIGSARAVDDWPSVNLMVRRVDFLAVGGFNTEYWPGEDTKFCMELIQRTGRRIMYVPELIVWHHRRGTLRDHLRQVGAYGLHRGYFARRYPETSRRLPYFLPSLFVIFLATSVLAGWLPSPLPAVITMGWLLYLIALARALWDFLKHERLGVCLCALWFTVLTHVVYGLRFIQGLVFTQRLVSTLR